ncbi:MAG: hypothetical protein GQ557_01980 [Mycoplasmataceae bacterium]|nr:hypothetical protein [Mycoplasmataceae bacterium]
MRFQTTTTLINNQSLNNSNLLVSFASQNQRSNLDYIIYGLLLLISILVALGAIFYYLYRYKKEQRKFFTINKISLISLFYAIFIVQELLTVLIQPWTVGMATFIPISMSEITIITVGFIFGPLEGIMFGAICDPTNVFLIHHWTFQLLPFFTLPLTGLMAGIMGRFFFKKDGKSSPWYSFIVFQLVLVFFAFMLIVSAPTIKYFWDQLGGTEGSFEENKTLFIFGVSSGTIMLVFSEMFFLFLFNKTLKSDDEKDKKNLNLFVMIFFIEAVTRLWGGIIIRPFTQYFYYGLPYYMQLVTRLLDSSYLVPLSTLFTWFMIRYSLIALKTTTTITP